MSSVSLDPTVDASLLEPSSPTIKQKDTEESNQLNSSVSEKESDVSASKEASTSNSRKRKHDDANLDDKPSQSKDTDDNAQDTPSNLSCEGADTKSNPNAAVVAQHYNSIEEKGLSFRAQSRIVYMRNFNNWIKSQLINEYLEKIRSSCSHGTPIKVLDMCCGKGGDLRKWKSGAISHLICADIADMSVKQCEIRYKDLSKNFTGKDQGYSPLFTAEFITADCTKVRLREKFKDASTQLDLVSCQFALHYSFESLPQAQCMIQNASESLKPGGYFIATFPNAYDLVLRWRNAEDNKFGNSVYNVEFIGDKQDIPLFGAKYHFHLEGVVDCPEFLVYLPLLKKIAAQYGLEFISFERFDEFYARNLKDGKSLLRKMEALETYPPYHEAPLLGQGPGDYLHAVQYMQSSTGHRKIGTLSFSEWEAISLYAVATFKKMKTTWNADGKPEYSK